MNTADVGSAISLCVSRQEFTALRDELQPPVRPKITARAALFFDNGRLGITSADTSVSILASGTWLGVARVPLYFILTALRNPPVEDPVLVTVRDSRLHIGNSSISCQWQARPARRRTKPHPRVTAPAIRLP